MRVTPPQLSPFPVFEPETVAVANRINEHPLLLPLLPALQPEEGRLFRKAPRRWWVARAGC